MAAISNWQPLLLVPVVPNLHDQCHIDRAIWYYVEEASHRPPLPDSHCVDEASWHHEDGDSQRPSSSGASFVPEPSGNAPGASSEAHVPGCTTMVILNIPYAYPAWRLKADIDATNLPYDYFHFPKDSRRGRNRGFAFVNLTTPAAAREFYRAFQNRLLLCPGKEEKRITVMPSTLQGRDNNMRLHPGSGVRA